MSFQQSRGFTLVELMIVVVIVSVLAMLAVVGYRKIIQSSHVTEATNMVQNIRVAEEAYRSETQEYATTSGAIDDYYPASPVYEQVTGWGADNTPKCSGASCVKWSALPVHVDGPVLFGYAAISGLGGVAPGYAATQPEDGSPTPSFAAAPPTDWFVISAAADLDGDKSNYTHVYGVSTNNQVIVQNDGL
ncbi:MAG: type IV pilin protein [Polyangiaceae bacterium]